MQRAITTICMLLQYLSPAKDTLVIVAINDTNIVFSNVAFKCPASAFPVLQYETCDVPDHGTTPLGNIAAPAGGSFVADMQAMSIKTFVVPLGLQTGISTGPTSQPASYELNQNYPNPFNPTTNFEFRVSGLGFVTLKVYDVLGREVAVLVNDARPPGVYTVRWDASGYASGVYMYRLQAGTFVKTKKMIHTK